jgi:hypothetical protein
LLVHSLRRADSRAACTAGSWSATRTPMIAITTNSSTSVKPVRLAAQWMAGFRLKCRETKKALNIREGGF